MQTWKGSWVAFVWLAVLAGVGCGGDDDSPACGAGECLDAGAGEDGGGEPDAGPGPIEDADDFYSPDRLVEIELTLPPESLAGLEAAPREYQPGTLRVGDLVLEDVGVRLKGGASFRGLDGKASFKVKTDELVAGQRLFGLRRLTLNNDLQDPSGLHERLGYRFMRAAGVAAPRCNSARVSVNGEYWGLYANVESIDDEFVEAQFGAPAGNLYDSVYFADLLPGAEAAFELETNTDTADRSDLHALVLAANDPSGTFVDDVAPLLDLDAVLELGAAQAILADWDGYFGARNNYKLYHDPVSDRFVILPWGIDQTFGASDSGWDAGGPYDIWGSQSERYNGWIFIRCKEEPACRDLYEQAVRDALDRWRELPLVEELEAAADQIRASVAEEPRRESDDPGADFENEFRRTRSFIRGRADEVSAELDGPPRELCENDEDDDADGEVDCDDGDCQPLGGEGFASVCRGQDDSCAEAPPPDVAPDQIAVSGWVVGADYGYVGIPDATIEAIANADGSTLATTTSDPYGGYELTIETGGAPLDVTIRQSASGRITNEQTLPALARDTLLWVDVLFREEELDALAAEAGIVRDPAAGIVILQAADCQDVRLFYPEVSLDPAPPSWDALLALGEAVLLNVPPGDLEATGSFEGRTFGPATVTSVAGEVRTVQLRPGLR